MKEQEIQEFYVRALNAQNIPYIHILNRTFGKYRTPLNLKYLPDLIFYWNKQLYLREFGVKNRHLERKNRQYAVMKRWKKEGADILIITSMEGAKEDLTEIGLIV